MGALLRGAESERGSDPVGHRDGRFSAERAKTAFLGAPEEANPSLHRQKHPLSVAELSSYVQSRTRLDELRDSYLDSTYRTAVASVSLSRYLCENADDLGPSLLGRMLEVHDFPLLFVPLVEEPPWTRRRFLEGKGGGGGGRAGAKGGGRAAWEKLDDRNAWSEVSPSDLLRLTKHEGQPWLALFHLTSSPACRASYGLDECRKGRLMRLRKYLHEALTDQLPVAGDVARYLDELSVTGVPPAGAGARNGASKASETGLLLTRVDVLRESLMRGGGGRRGGRGSNDNGGRSWEDVARRQWEDIFSKVADATDGTLRRIAAEVYGGTRLGDEPEVVADVDLGGGGGGASPRNDASSRPPGEERKAAASMLAEEVTLRLTEGDENGGASVATFRLTPLEGTAKTTDTPRGPYHRAKMSVERTDGDSDAVHPGARVAATVRFGERGSRASSSSSSSANSDIELALDSLELPTMERPRGDHDEVGIALPESDFPSREWRQLGDATSALASGGGTAGGAAAILQLGFKRLARGTVSAGERRVRAYVLDRAFLSRPAA
ncbi:hypothetical protein ACHAWF_012369 [Thalassiosira exigua]